MSEMNLDIGQKQLQSFSEVKSSWSNLTGVSPVKSWMKTGLSASLNDGGTKPRDTNCSLLWTIFFSLLPCSTNFWRSSVWLLLAFLGHLRCNSLFLSILSCFLSACVKDNNYNPTFLTPVICPQLFQNFFSSFWPLQLSPAYLQIQLCI